MIIYYIASDAEMETYISDSGSVEVFANHCDGDTQLAAMLDAWHKLHIQILLALQNEDANAHLKTDDIPF